MENSTSQISKLDHGKEGLRTFCILTQYFMSTQLRLNTNSKLNALLIAQ